MAKILVADDNSNVQKTVALALAELGVEVASVNNGEAAVRKLSDFSPDLVLADIFMPVRNGYEVCEYVKKDSRFSHVPVVLLVGAFDPLDEREAQRVGADGILKKPFVPPDPLITMVKALLERTMGDRLVGVAVSKPAVAAQSRSTATAIAEVHAPEPEIFEEPSSPEFPAPIAKVAFGEGDHPVAFGQLLETAPQEVTAKEPAAIEPVDDEQILTHARDATLGDPIFWRNDSHEPEPEAAQPEEEESALSIEMRAWRQTEDSLPRREEAALLQPIEPLELVRDEPDEVSPSIVDSGSVVLDPAEQTPLTVESDKAEDLAANPIEWMASAPPEHSEDDREPTPGWDEPIPDAPDTIDAVEATDTLGTIEHVESPEPVPASTPVAAKVSEPVPVPVLAKSDIPVIDKVATLITTKTEIPTIPAVSSPKAPNALSLAAQSVADTARSIPRKDWDDLAASFRSKATESVSQQIKSEPTPVVQVPPTEIENPQPATASSSQAASPDPALVEAVVQRVLDKMRPQVVDIITKEFLRPIVQALVHREIEKH